VTAIERLSETRSCWFIAGMARHVRRIPFPLLAASPHHRQHAGSRFSWLQPHLILHYDTGTTSYETVHLPRQAVMHYSAWVDEVLHQVVQRWTFTQSFALSASTLML